jgi:hypothetical protein
MGNVDGGRGLAHTTLDIEQGQNLHARTPWLFFTD